MDIQFGEFHLYLRNRQLLGPAGPIDIGARSYDILLLLLQRAGSVVGKGDLLDAVWPGLAVEENTLQVHVSALRKALGAAMIVTVHGRGYMYAGPSPCSIDAPSVETKALGSGWFLENEATLDAATPKTERNKELTSIAVLPFVNLSGNADHDVLADGLVEDIITELARYRNLAVTGNRISSQFRDRRGGLAEISRALGVDFILDGSIRLAGSTVRVVVELIDVETAAHAWGDRFNCEMVDIFSVQDEIVGAIIGRLAFNLTEAAGRKQKRDQTSSGSAYTHFLQARAAWRESDSQRAMQAALRAIEIDPDYGRAHAYVGFFYGFSQFSQWLPLDEEEIMRRARHAIERALAIDRSDPFILLRASMTYLLLGEPQTALRYAEVAAGESARDSEMLVIHGMALAYCGDHAKARGMIEHAMTLDRRLSPSLYLGLIEVCHLMSDYTGSLAAIQMMPDPPFYIRMYEAASLARLGRTAEARHLLEQAPPGFDTTRFARSQARTCALVRDAEHWLESFRLAGVEV